MIKLIQGKINNLKLYNKTTKAEWKNIWKTEETDTGREKYTSSAATACFCITKIDCKLIDCFVLLTEVWVLHLINAYTMILLQRFYNANIMEISQV